MEPVIFMDYHLEHVTGSIRPELAQDVVDFWVRHGAIPDPDKARGRLPQVRCIARNRASEIVAVTTAYTADYGSPPVPHYYTRMFIRPQDRRSGLSNELFMLTRESLAQAYRPGMPEQGLIVVTENPLLMRPEVEALFKRFGWSLEGKDPRGSNIWRLGIDQMKPPADWRSLLKG